MPVRIAIVRRPSHPFRLWWKIPFLRIEVSYQPGLDPRFSSVSATCWVIELGFVGDLSAPGLSVAKPSNQSRRIGCVSPSSALPHSTDVLRSARQFRFVQIDDMGLHRQLKGAGQRKAASRWRQGGSVTLPAYPIQSASQYSGIPASRRAAWMRSRISTDLRKHVMRMRRSESRLELEQVLCGLPSLTDAPSSKSVCSECCQRVSIRYYLHRLLRCYVPG